LGHFIEVLEIFIVSKVVPAIISHDIGNEVESAFDREVLEQNEDAIEDEIVEQGKARAQEIQFIRVRKEWDLLAFDIVSTTDAD
jgi:hypothetical protein